jgi:tetratricopeptide (TPR) repeat protein
MRRYEEALADFNRAIELDPSHNQDFVSRGEIYRLTRRYDQALADFNRAVELDPDNFWAVARRGKTYLRMKRYGATLADLKRMIKLKERQAAQDRSRQAGTGVSTTPSPPD